MEEKVQVPHDESATEKSTSVTDAPCHTIEMDRNVTIKLGRFLEIYFCSVPYTIPF